MPEEDWKEDREESQENPPRRKKSRFVDDSWAHWKFLPDPEADEDNTDTDEKGD